MKTIKVFPLLVFLLFAVNVDMEETAVVRIRQGDLRGLKVKTDSGAIYYSFRAIPYAKPPVGPLRFKPPEPEEPWEGIRDAIETAPVAPQISIFTKSYEGTEDCLFINVFTPHIPADVNTKLKPVVLYIHGGGYILGSGNNEMHGPARFMDTGKVVLVTINYRLGALGFLSTGDSVVQGNNGLKDQVLSLKWVQENIAKFGGDPNSVTIAGISAGGSSTHLQLFSPLSKGLFHKAIAQSGSALAPWSAQEPDHARRTLPAQTIIEGLTLNVPQDKFYPLENTFLPVVERGGNTNTMFLSEKPLKLIREKKFQQVPFITGVTSREGLLIFGDPFESTGWYEAVDKYLEAIFKVHLNLEEGTTQSKELKTKIKKYYFGEKPISKDTWGVLIDIYSDFIFNIWADQGAKEQTKISESPLYFYQFSYVGKSASERSEKTLTGASHADDLSYLFETEMGPSIVKELHGDDKKVSDKFIKMWINFAKTGNPTPQKDDFLGVSWTPFTKTDHSFLDIDKELTIQNDFYGDRMKFWNDLLSE